MTEESRSRTAAATSVRTTSGYGARAVVRSAVNAVEVEVAFLNGFPVAVEPVGAVAGAAATS